ncbi:MAG: DUF2938 family protein [Candidatus Puniceispirillaceae bacterium]|jgi:hypothetical protein
MGLEVDINEILIAGVMSCLVMDTFQRLLFITHKIPPSNWGMVGRWAGYLFTRGKLINAEIDNLPAISGETSLGWLVHYLVGIGYALVYFGLREIGWLDNSFYSGAIFGIASVVVPWFFFLPAMGKGILARLTDNPRFVCFLGLINHLVFGLGMAFGFQLAVQMAVN